MEGVWYLLGAIFAAIICAMFSFNHFMSKSRINQHPMLANVKVMTNSSSECLHADAANDPRTDLAHGLASCSSRC